MGSNKARFEDIHGKRSYTTVHDLHTLADSFLGLLFVVDITILLA